MTDLELEIKLAGINQSLKEIETEILSCITSALDDRVKGNRSVEDDAGIFAPHTAYVKPALLNGFPRRPLRLWLTQIKPLVEEADKRLNVNSQPPIDTTEVMRSAATCSLFSWDYDRFFMFLAEVGDSDMTSLALLLGDDSSSRQQVLLPIAMWVASEWGSMLDRICGESFQGEELEDLIKWLSNRPTDAIQLVVALHRLAGLVKVADNQAAQHLRLQVLSDLLVIVESSLRLWQTGVDGQLFNRVEALFQGNPVAAQAFSGKHSAFNNQFAKAQRESTAAVNWVIQDTIQSLINSNSTSERAGIAAYLVYKLRNSVMHVLDDQTDLFADRKLLLKAVGVTLAVIRLSKHGADGTLGNLN